jgi:hypothetical protein
MHARDIHSHIFIYMTSTFLQNHLAQRTTSVQRQSLFGARSAAMAAAVPSPTNVERASA